MSVSNEYLQMLAALNDEVRARGINPGPDEWVTSKRSIDGRDLYVTNLGGVYAPDGGFLGSSYGQGNDFVDIQANPDGGYILVRANGAQDFYRGENTRYGDSTPQQIAEQQAAAAPPADGGRPPSTISGNAPYVAPPAAPAEDPKPSIDTDPAWLAFLRQFGIDESDARMYAERQRAKITQSLTEALPEVARQGVEGRKNLALGMEGRGILRSGETETRMADSQAAEAAQVARINSAAAQDQMAVEQALADRLAALNRNKEEQKYNAERGLNINWSAEQATNQAATAQLDQARQSAAAAAKAQSDYYDTMINAYNTNNYAPTTTASGTPIGQNRVTPKAV